MKKKETLGILLFLIVVFLYGCSAIVNKDDILSKIKEKELILKDSSKLLYSVFDFKGESNDSIRPLIISLHYGWRGRMPSYFGKAQLVQLIIPVFKDLGAVLVAPDCPGVNWTDYKSENAIFELINQLKKDYKIDTNKIALVGYSMGGMGIWYLVGNHKRTFSAGIIISGNANDEWVTDIGETPLYVIHSSRDELLPIANVQRTIDMLLNLNKNITFVPVRGLSHYSVEGFLPYLEESLPWLRKQLGLKN